MLNELKTYSLRISSIVATLALVACGSLSQVSGEGTTEEPVWPEATNATFDVGAYPNLDSLRLVDRGMTKDQLYNLLGRPHFAEGLVGVREWDYLFHFRTPQGDVSCQYKVLFDKEKRAQTLLWKPADCSDLLAPRQEAPAAKSYTLDSDVLFGFGSAALTTAGQAEVARVAQAVAQHNANVTVTGHTDHIGSDAANLALSQRRAQSVRDVLAAHGVQPARITAYGAGEAQPVVQCAPGSRAAEIACLSPNRRVEINTH